MKVAENYLLGPGKHLVFELKRIYSQSTYIYRVQSSVLHLPNYWPPIPSPPSECVLPPSHQRRRGTHSPGGKGGGGSIFRKTPDIGLASYNIIPLRIYSTCLFCVPGIVLDADDVGGGVARQREPGEGQKPSHRHNIYSKLIIITVKKLLNLTSKYCISEKSLKISMRKSSKAVFFKFKDTRPQQSTLFL
jgi:hypothetical protein